MNRWSIRERWQLALHLAQHGVGRRVISSALHSRLKPVIHSERGANLVLIALAMTVLLGFTGLAIDGSNIYYQQQRMQIAADAAALGGARLLALEATVDTVETEIQNLAQANAAHAVEWLFINEGRGVNVRAERTIESYFARILGYEQFTVSATSEAQWEPLVETEGLFPMTISCDCVEEDEIIYVNQPITYPDGITPPGHDTPPYDSDYQVVEVEIDEDSAYEFTFVSLVENTWTYQVRELEGRDLSHWLLNIPSCLGNITSYTPAGADLGIDGSTGYSGIKWDLDDNFTQGVFSFTLDDAYPIGSVNALAKAGPSFGTAPIKGPICDGSDPYEGEVDDEGNQIALCLPTINFQNDDSGGTLSVGQKIVNQWTARGIHVTTHNPSAHPAMIFGSGNPTGNDWHLGTPNQGFGGPGQGFGGAPGMPGENSAALGNVLIISEDGNSSNPDDNADGGSLIFTFDVPVRMDEVHILGIRDDAGAGTVTLYDTTSGGGDPIASRRMLGLGSNSFQVVPLDSIGVRRMDISLPKGGALTEVVFCRTQQEPRYRIGDLIWADINGDGIKDQDEPGIEGVKLELYVAGQNDRVAWTETNAHGRYLFDNLPAGNYEVKLPAVNFEAGGPLAETLYSPGSPFDGSTGIASITLPGEFGDNLDIDGGFMPPAGEEFEGPDQGTVYLENNMHSKYRFTFLGVDGTTWRYYVEELQGRDLSHWNLLIGDCVTPVNLISGHTGPPEYTEFNIYDGSTGKWGPKWDLQEQFSEGEFSFTLDREYHPTVVEALAKTGGGRPTEGHTYAMVPIIGPDCSNPITEETEPTPTPQPDPDPDAPQMCTFSWLDLGQGTTNTSGLGDLIRGENLFSFSGTIGDLLFPSTGDEPPNATISGALNDRIQNAPLVKIPLHHNVDGAYIICGFAYVELVNHEVEEESRWIELEFWQGLFRGDTIDNMNLDFGARDVRILQ